MEETVYICPICSGKVLYKDEAKEMGDPPLGLPGPQIFYCPHCEMLVEAIARPSSQLAEAHFPEAGRENRGRTREAGTNSGGSQGGDMSDQGAAQWRRDPLDDERNTWSDKT
jgi:hypothetical protein